MISMLFGSIERKDVSMFCMFKEKGFVGIAWQWVRSKRKGDFETAYVYGRITDIETTEEEAVIPSFSQWPTFWQTIRNGLLRRSLEICCELGLFVRDHAKDSRTHIRVGNRLVGKEMVNIQMKGRHYVPLENLNTAETEKLHLDDVLLLIIVL